MRKMLKARVIKKLSFPYDAIPVGTELDWNDEGAWFEESPGELLLIEKEEVKEFIKQGKLARVV